MQNVKFTSVEECFDFLPENELRIVEVLRNLIFDFVPGVTEKLSFNVPFYKKHKGLFFIWPASVFWGNKQTYNGVRFGFQQGFLLEDEINYLEKGSRKQVFWRDFTKVKEEDVDILKAYIFEAAIIDENFKKAK